MEKFNERNGLLQKIYWAAGDYKFDELEAYVREYLDTYGALTGGERVWFLNSRDGFTACDVLTEEVEEQLLFLATKFTKDFFFAFIRGDEAAAKESRRKAELQAELKQAFEDRDVVLFDKLLSAGADINYSYYDPYRDHHKTTLWEEIRSGKGAMWEYFMTRTEIPEVKELLEREKAEKELIAARKAQMA